MKSINSDEKIHLFSHHRSRYYADDAKLVFTQKECPSLDHCQLPMQRAIKDLGECFWSRCEDSVGVWATL